MNFSQLGFGSFTFKTHGIILSILFVVFIWNYYQKIKDQKFPVDFFVDNFWKWFLISVFSARMFTLILNPSVVKEYSLFSLLAFWQAEVSIPILMLTFIVCLAWNLKNQQFSFRRWLDLAVEPLLLMLSLEAFFAFFTGDRYGIPTALPWGVRYETFSVAEVNAVHPVTIYSMIVYVSAYLYYRKESKIRKWKDRVFKGALFIRFLYLVFLTEGVLFFLRGDVTPINNSIISKEFIIFCFSFLVLILMQKVQNKSFVNLFQKR